MSDDSDMGVGQEERPTTARRDFLKRAGQVAVTTPAVTLLLSAGARSGFAGVTASPPPGEDGTTTNSLDNALDSDTTSNGDGICQFNGGSDSDAVNLDGECA